MDEPTPIGPEPDDTAHAATEELPDGLAAGAPNPGDSTNGGFARRGLLVLAVFAVVVAGAVAFALVRGDGDGDAATESESDTDLEDDADDGGDGDTDDADDTAGDGEDAEASDGGVEPTEERGAYSVTAAADDSYFYGGEAPMPWGDGFLAIRQEFVPSEVTLLDLIPDAADRLPAEVNKVLQAAGIDLGQPGSIDEAITALGEAGIYDQMLDALAADADLMSAYDTVLSGGSSQQVAEFSADGVTWEPVDLGLGIPEHAWPEYRSNGDHLIAVVTDNSYGPDGLRLDFSITVHATSDLQSWSSVEIPVVLPDVADYVQTDAWTDQVAVGPDGWFLGVSVNEYIDLWPLLPERIQNSEYGWTPAPEGIRIEDWQAVYDAEFEASESGEPLAVDALEPEIIEVISWDELPLTYAEWNLVGYGSESQRQTFTGTFGGAVGPAGAPPGLDWFQLTGTPDGFVAWGQIHTPSDVTLQDLVPDIADRFPAEIVDTLTAAGFDVGDVNSLDAAAEVLDAAGLLDLASQVLADDPELMDAYLEVANGGVYETVAFFSADGSSWSSIDFPAVEWADAVAPVAGGLLLIGSSEQGGQQFWLADSQGRSWEPVAGPELGEQLWLSFDTRAAGGDGLAAVVDSGHADSPMYLAWSATVEHDGFELTMSADGAGSQSLRIVELASGDVRRDVTIEMWSEELFVWGEETFDFLDDDGELIVSVPSAVGEELAWRAESEAWEEWHAANPYQPELTLVATIDGREWIVQQLEVDATAEGWYGGGAAAINNGVAIYRDQSGWHRVVVG